MWVDCELPVAGGAICCSSAWVEPSGGLLEVRRRGLDGWLRVLERVEEIWKLG